jgi:hypothetical protein
MYDIIFVRAIINLKKRWNIATHRNVGDCQLLGTEITYTRFNYGYLAIITTNHYLNYLADTVSKLGQIDRTQSIYSHTFIHWHEVSTSHSTS